MDLQRVEKIVGEMESICIGAAVYDPLRTAKIVAEVHQSEGWGMLNGETYSEFNRRVVQCIRLGMSPTKPKHQ